MRWCLLTGMTILNITYTLEPRGPWGLQGPQNYNYYLGTTWVSSTISNSHLPWGDPGWLTLIKILFETTRIRQHSLHGQEHLKSKPNFQEAENLRKPLNWFSNPFLLLSLYFSLSIKSAGFPASDLEKPGYELTPWAHNKTGVIFGCPISFVALLAKC